MFKKIMFMVCALALIFLAIQPVSALQKLAVTVPTPKAPSGIIRDTTPTYEWSRIVGASEYKIQVVKKNSTVFIFTIPNDIACDEYKCTATPGGNIAFQGTIPGYILGPGAYTWRVQAKIGKVWKSYSLARAFSYATVPDTRNPAGTISMTTPQYSFSSIVGATKYQVELKKGQKLFYVQTFTDANCDEFGYCDKTPETVLANGTYAWRVRTYVEGVWKAFSAWHEFKLVDHVTVFVPADSFQMGCDPLHNNVGSCYPAQLPLHTISLSAFWMDKYEVTIKQYKECVADNVCLVPEDWSSNTRDNYYTDPKYANYPVVYVTRDQAAMYCAWTGGVIPSEAQWEKAARGRSPRAFPWGDSPADCSKANYAPNAYGDVFCENDTSQVGNYPLGASPYGAMDMAGNVLEWVKDNYSDTYYSTSPASEPSGPESTGWATYRGGSYYDSSSPLGTDYRFMDLPDEAYNSLGFRCLYFPE